MTEPINAEVIETTQALAVRPQTGLPTVQDLEQQFALAVRQRELLSEYIKKQLVPGKHFYQRGTQKPSLAKEGAEIILLPHNLAPDYEQTGGPDAPPADNRPYQITVKCILRRKGDPTSFVGSGIGSAGSEKQLKDGSYQPRQNDKYLCHNATLKMAQKSAMIAATINSTAASEFFTQDMDPDASESTGKPRTAAASHPPPRQTTPPAKPSAKAKQEPGKAIVATPGFRTKMLERLHARPGEANALIAKEFFEKIDWLLPTETLDQLALRYVPVNPEQMTKLIDCLENFNVGIEATKPYPPNDPEEPPETAHVPPLEKPEEDKEAWRTFPMPFGKNAGVKLEDLEKNYLFGLWANYEVEREYRGKPRTVDQIERDETFRAMLDLAGKHYEFKNPDK